MDMGGHGSGRTGGRPTYESTASLVLTITSFVGAGLRVGLKGNASLTFGNRGDPFTVSIDIDATDPQLPYLQLRHARRTCPALPESYCVHLEMTAQQFGGVRWWFRCPRTHRRCRKLFLPLGGHQFWSRYAYGLGYASQREDARGRAQQQAVKIYAALGGDRHWMDGPPPKPKWMRWRTYARLADKLDRYNHAFDASSLASIGRFLARHT